MNENSQFSALSLQLTKELTKPEKKKFGIFFTPESINHIFKNT